MNYNLNERHEIIPYIKLHVIPDGFHTLIRLYFTDYIHLVLSCNYALIVCGLLA